MSGTTGSAVFLDTSIKIASMIHSPETKDRIAKRIAEYTLVVTSEVVWQEFKRRLLQEVQWCLNQLNDPRNPKTFEQLSRHVSDVLPVQQQRKKNICTQLCATVSELPNRRGEDDRTERARRHFRTMLKTGRALFEMKTHVVKASGCACAAHPIREVKPYVEYSFGPARCDQCGSDCRVGQFLATAKEPMVEIQTKLAALPTSKKLRADGKPTELGSMESFLKRYLDEGVDPVSINPCLTVGDLMIALESRRVPAFYTMNSKESWHLCRWLGQTLVIRKVYHIHEDVIYDAADPAWPSL